MLKRERKIDDRLTNDAIRIKAKKNNAAKVSIRQMQVPKEEKFTQISNKNQKILHTKQSEDISQVLEQLEASENSLLPKEQSIQFSVALGFVKYRSEADLELFEDKYHHIKDASTKKSSANALKTFINDIMGFGYFISHSEQQRIQQGLNGCF